MPSGSESSSLRRLRAGSFTTYSEGVSFLYTLYCSGGGLPESGLSIRFVLDKSGSYRISEAARPAALFFVVRNNLEKDP